jgi:membrane peptidoglycan carboxypeptidase
MALLGERRKSFLKFVGLLLGAIVSLAAILILMVGAVFYNLNREKLVDLQQCYTTAWRNVEVCPGNQNYVRMSQVPDHLKWAVILSEDASFYQHSGFDWFEIQKSIDTNLEKRAYVRGASTISQQLAKNLYLSGEKSLFRKIKEALLTRRIEKAYSKEQILEAYFNIVELGNDVYGFKKAARHYFGLDLSELGPSHSAFLATLLPSPVRYESYLFQRNQVHPEHLERIRRTFHLLIRHQRVDSSYASVFEARDGMGYWTSLQTLPSDDMFRAFSENSLMEDDWDEELLTAPDHDEGELVEELSPNPLDGPVGTERTQDDQDTEIN